MKDLIIKNINEVEAVFYERGEGNNFYVKPVVDGENIDTCAVAFVEVPPKNYAFGYHWHDQSEEIFYIVKGEGKLRTFYGEKDVKQGDMMCFPKGEKGAHVLTNTSESETLIFIDFGVRPKADIVVLPDANKLMVVGEYFPFTMLDMPK